MHRILFITLFIFLILISNSFANQQDEKQIFKDMFDKMEIFHDLFKSFEKDLNLQDLLDCLSGNKNDRFCSIAMPYINGFDTSKIFHIKLYRSYLSDKCIIGYLTVNNIFMAHTLELPWENNAKEKSAISAGTYYGYLRYDHKDKWRIELLDVPKRDNIQIHSGNKTEDTTGCILIGKKVDINSCSILQGTSELARKDIKTAFYSQEDMCPERAIVLTIVDNYFPVLKSKK